MSDLIHVRDLLVRTIIGLNPDERLNKQDVLINLELTVDTRQAGATDDVSFTANYRTITKQVIQLVEASEFYLVEKMAAEIARLCLADLHVKKARVTVEKPTALRFARSVGVTIERTRGEL